MSRKLAPRVFGRKAPPHARETLLLILIWHRENPFADWNLVLGCVVAPKSTTNQTLEVGKGYDVAGGTVTVHPYTFPKFKGFPRGSAGVLLIIDFAHPNAKNYQWVQTVVKDTLPNRDPKKIVPYIDQASKQCEKNYYYPPGAIDVNYRPDVAVFQDRPYGTGPGELRFELRLVDTTKDDVTLFQFNWGFDYNQDGTVTAVPVTGGPTQ